MRIGQRSIGAAICGLAWLLAGAAGVAAAELDLGGYHALLIGNNSYRHLPRLKTAVADAEAMAELLARRYGFATEILRDAGKREILGAINRYRANLGERDNLLIYYAGHGWLDRQTDTGFWQPVDAEPDDDLNWIANGELTRRLNAMAARHVMVIADSCYSGTLLRGAESSLPTGEAQASWLARMAAKRSRTALVSGGLEPVADSGRGAHSVFASALLEVLAENAAPLDGNELFRRVGRPVVLNAEQTPQYSDIRRAGHEGGSFIFVPEGARVLVLPPAGGAAPAVPPIRTPAALRFPDYYRLDEDIVLRGLPKAWANQVGAFAKGARVLVIGRVDETEWYRIDNKGIIAYAHAPALRPETPAEAAEGRRKPAR